MHEADVEPRLFGEIENERGARLQHRGADRALGHHPGRDGRVDSGAGRQEQAFGVGEHLHGEADVDRELEGESLSVLTDVRGRAELAQDRLDAAVGVLVAADHDRQRSRLHLRDAPGDRRIQQRRAALACPLGQLPAHARADGTDVHPDLVRGEPGEDSVRAGGGRLQSLVVGKRGEDDLGGLCHLAWRVAPA